MNTSIYVKIKKTTDRVMEKVYTDNQVDYDATYLLLGFGGDKVFVQVGQNIIDLFPSKVSVVSSN